MTRRCFLAQSVVLALRQGRPEDATQLIEQQTSSGQVSAATFLARGPSFALRRAFGQAKTIDALFLLASLTKPMTASALMVLADGKEVSLSDPVQRFIPEFKGDGREAVLIKHLLTHTSGLPDMLPEDQELRKAHAPLSAFVERTCRTPLLFRPGSELRYQSMGILLAGEIVSRVGNYPLPVFAKKHVFEPLTMLNTSIGLGGRPISETMRSQVSNPSDWDWNSSYWRNLGSPWGGAFSNVDDVGRFLEYFANPDQRVVKAATAASMITNQTDGLKDRWGLGWMLNNNQFGTGCSSATFGHSGSTGTLCWLDPKSHVSFVLLTTRPAKESTSTLLYPVSNAISLRA
jgi:CubicO group peptidase (beta-lactamase class C family)